MFAGGLLCNYCAFVRFCNVTEGVLIAPSSELPVISGTAARAVPLSVAGNT
jgi:hypothetical protein